MWHEHSRQIRSSLSCSMQQQKPHLKVGNELARVLAKGAMVGDVATRLHEQQVIKGLKDVNTRLVDGAHHSAACVDSVAHTPHDNGCCSGIKSCTFAAIAATRHMEYKASAIDDSQTQASPQGKLIWQTKANGMTIQSRQFLLSCCCANSNDQSRTVMLHTKA